MTEKARNAIAYYHAMSPLHVGSGRSLDVIDLPIARERSTDLPTLPGSGNKGMLREAVESSEPGGEAADIVWSLFGPSTEKASEHAGAVTFGDGRLLLFPVRSVRQIFAWVTSPYLLRRYVRDREDLGFPVSPEETRLRSAVEKDSALVSSAQMLAGSRLHLEDGDMKAAVSKDLEKFAVELGKRLGDKDLAEMLPQRLALVDDTRFGYYARHATEIVARIKLGDETKTVAKGGLWYEESVPAEAVFYVRVMAEGSRHDGARRTAYTAKDHLDRLVKVTSAVIGGKATVGRGLCAIRWEVK